MQDAIYQIINCFYFPQNPETQNLDMESQAEYNKKVASAIYENLKEYYGVTDEKK